MRQTLTAVLLVVGLVASAGMIYALDMAALIQNPALFVLPFVAGVSFLAVSCLTLVKQ